MTKPLKFQAIFAALLMSMFLTGCKKNAPAESMASAPLTALELTALDLFQANKQAHAQTVPVNGSLLAVQQVMVGSPVDGRVLTVLVRAGDHVSKNQVLAQMDVTDLDTRLAERRAAVASAQAQLRLAEQGQKSKQALFQQGYISQNAFDETGGNVTAQRAMLESQTAQLTLLARLRHDSAVRSPQAGIIATRDVQPGQELGPKAKMFTVVSLKNLELEASISADQLAHVSVGQTVSFKVEGFGARPFSGKVARINPMTQAGTRAIPIYIAVENVDEALRVGLYATGEIITQMQDVILIPSRAITGESGRQSVWVVAHGKLMQRTVNVGATERDSGMTVIESGLSSGEQVVVAQLTNPIVGQAVKLTAGVAK